MTVREGEAQLSFYRHLFGAFGSPSGPSRNGGFISRADLQPGLFGLRIYSAVWNDRNDSTQQTALLDRRISSWVESFEVNMTWDGGCFLSRLKLPKEFPPSLASSRMERIPIPASEHECRCHLVLSRKDTS